MIRPLTSFRFLAALAVFCSHLGYLAAYENTAPLWNRVLSEGYAGVTFFFVLSGFILTYTYADRFRSLEMSTLLPYLTARIGRIVPVHVLSFIAVLPLAMSAEIQPDRGLEAVVTGALSLTMLLPLLPIPGVGVEFNTPAWSLTVEMLFYVTLPLALVAIGVPSARRIRKFAFSVLVLWVFMGMVAFAFSAEPTAGWLFFQNPAFRVVDFCFGMVLAFRFRRGAAAWSTSRMLGTLAEVVSLAGLAAAIWWFPHVPQALRFGVYYLPFMALVIWVFAHSSGALSSVLSIRPLVWLGEISFSFYMFHQIVIRYFLRSLGEVPVRGLWAALAMLMSTIIVSALVYRLYETPLRKAIRDWVKRRYGAPVRERRADTESAPPVESLALQPTGA